MTSIRQQIWQTVAGDSEVLSLLPNGAADIFGRDDVLQLPSGRGRVLVLELDAASQLVEGLPWLMQVVRWRALDFGTAGWSWCNTVLSKVQRLFPDVFNQTVYYDPDTKERVFWRSFIGTGPETVDVTHSRTMRWAEWELRKVYAQ